MPTNVEIPDELDEQLEAIVEREAYASKSELVRQSVRIFIDEHTDYEFARCTECDTVGFAWDAEETPGNCPFCNGGPYIPVL